MSKNILIVLIALCPALSIKQVLSENKTIAIQKQSDKVDPKKAFSKDEYSLYKATYMGRTSKVKKLIDNGVNVNVFSPNSKRTPMHIAVSKGRTEIIKILVENGKANLEIANSEGKTPLYFAVEGSKTDIIKYLKSKGAKITPEILKIANASIKSILTSTK